MNDRWIAVTLLILGLGCSPRPSEPPGFDVGTTCFPADYLARRVLGDGVPRFLVLPAGEDAPTYRPAPKDIARLAGTDLIVANGAGYEGWMATANLPTNKLVETAAELDLIAMKARTHSHGKGGEHSHEGSDPHTWSDPLQFKKQAGRVADVAAIVDGEHAGEHRSRFEALSAELDQLHAELAESLKGLRDKPVASNHPSFNYLARRYGIAMRAFDFDPAEAPSPEALAEFEAWRAGRSLPLWWESEPSGAARAAFAPEVQHVTVDPLEQPRDGRYDYLGQARANAKRFAALYGDAP